MNSSDPFGNLSSTRRLRGDAAYQTPDFVEAVPEMDEAVEEDQASPRRFYAMGAALVAVVAVIGVQCFRLQVKNGSVNQKSAEANSVRFLVTQPDRGLIVDDTGAILARNTQQLALAINPQTLPSKKADREAVYHLLKDKASIPQDQLDFIEANHQKSPDIFPLKTNLSKDESLLYKEIFADVKGVELIEIPIRTYASLPSLGQLVGYVGSVDQQDVKNGYALNQRVGKAGLEKQYNPQLTGTAGRQKVLINAQGKVVSQLPGGEDALPKDGQTLKLSIDSKLQTVVADALKHELARRTAKFGDLPKLGASAVVMDPNTGAIKAMVSLPDYDPELFAQGITQQQYNDLLNNPGNPLLNRAIQGQFPPGSTIKPLVASAGLQGGVITADTQMNTPDAIVIGKSRFPDWKVHGPTNTRKAIAESNDIFFYAVGGGWQERNFKGLGIDALNSYLRQFGLGSKLGVDIGGEASGLVADDAYKKAQFNERWFIGDTYHTAIGQGYTLTTPLQMATATAAIANGGTLWQPYLAQSVLDPDSGEETALPHQPIRQGFISPQNLEIVREGMRMTVESGSARPLNKLQVQSAGKTGTAQFGTQGLTHAWYTGYAPYDHPQIVFAIVIEGGGESFYSSVPVAEEILRGYFNEPLQPGQDLFANTQVPTDFQGEH